MAGLTTPLPYGMRDLKLTRYIDAAGFTLGATSTDLPNMQTLSFSEAEEFSELRGDDALKATHGKGAQVEWELEAGGMDLDGWSILTGGTIIESGLTPSKKVIMRKRGSDQRPYFRSEGQAISDSGGDVHAFLYRCKVNENVEGEFEDGEFFVTSASGVALPLSGTFDLLYDFVHNETAVPITLIPTANPTAS